MLKVNIEKYKKEFDTKGFVKIPNIFSSDQIDTTLNI